MEKSSSAVRRDTNREKYLSELRVLISGLRKNLKEQERPNKWQSQYVKDVGTLLGIIAMQEAKLKAAGL